jgi:FAD/FMN-containing dehydrogenase
MSSRDDQVSGAPERAARPFRPGDSSGIATLRLDLADLDCDASAEACARAAADFHWYSPVLAAALEGRLPDLVVRPRSIEEVIRVAAACVQHRVPLTVRGAGTGNYGQCVPLHGGVSLDMSRLNRVIELADGWARVEAGIVMFDLNEAARASGQQLRMWPSTERIATLGGFIAGGHSGIGSMRHGILADPGNVRSLQVVTLEDPPRLVELRGADIQKAHHAYGTNGIIVTVDIALTAAVQWQHVIALFPNYRATLACALDIGQRVCHPQPGSLDVFQLSTVERRITPYYDGLRERLQDQDAIFAQVAPASVPLFEDRVRAAGGSVAMRGTEADLIAAGLPPATECAYNHTTLQALKTDRGVTYLQVAYPVPFDPALVAAQCERFGDEVLMHHEFSQAAGQLTVFALPLVRYFDEQQLRDLIASFEADGCLVFDPHTWVLEDGGMKQVDELQLAFKRQADPLGLMNPGKVRAWDERVLGLPGVTL